MSMELRAQGKVRDIYEADAEHLILVASDRISAFDVVLPTPIPDKGRVLTGMSLYWFDKTADLVPNHVVSATGFDDPELRGRATLVRRADVIPVECVARGYITGSGWSQYQKEQTVCGIPLPARLVESERLPEPIFTPTTKAAEGHDMPLTPSETSDLIGKGLAEKLKELTLTIYERAASISLEKGIILADTKFEFGFADGEVTLIDEVCTPDSSRFWPADGYERGHGQPSFDKQYVRDWLDRSGWDHEPPPPDLPDDVVEQTRARYVEAYERITGESFARYLERMGATSG